MYYVYIVYAIKMLFSHNHVYIVHACICRFLHGNKADFSFNYVIYKKYISFQISFQIFCLFLFKVIVKLQWLSLKEPIATSPAFPETPEILRLSRNISVCLSLNPSLSISPSILFFLLWQKPISLFLRLTFIIIYKKKKERKKKNNVEHFF